MAPVHLVCHVATWSVYVWLVWILSGSVMSGWWHGPCSLVMLLHGVCMCDWCEFSLAQ